MVVVGYRRRRIPLRIRDDGRRVVVEAEVGVGLAMEFVVAIVEELVAAILVRVLLVVIVNLSSSKRTKTCWSCGCVESRHGGEMMNVDGVSAGVVCDEGMEECRSRCSSRSR